MWSRKDKPMADVSPLPHDHEGHSHPHENHQHSHDDHAHGENLKTGHAHTHEHRSLSKILDIIRSAPLEERVKARASRAFQLLGEAEAEIHSMPIEKVHFHEVGGMDTIVDLVCAAVGRVALGVDRWMASPLNVGSGTVECAHGTLPVPAPATFEAAGRCAGVRGRSGDGARHANGSGDPADA